MPNKIQISLQVSCTKLNRALDRTSCIQSNNLLPICDTILPSTINPYKIDDPNLKNSDNTNIIMVRILILITELHYCSLKQYCNHNQNMKVATKRVTNVHQVHVNSVTFHKLDNACFKTNRQENSKWIG